MREPEYEPDEERPYECFDCGNIVSTEDNPGSCPECGAEMRNRHYPIE